MKCDEHVFYKAAARGHEDIARLLLATGADMNKKGGIFGLMVWTASQNGRETIAQLLLEAGTLLEV